MNVMYACMHVCMYVDAVWNNSKYNYPLRQNPGKCSDLSSHSISQVGMYVGAYLVNNIILGVLSQ